jgi:hypothetical protein
MTLADFVHATDRRSWTLRLLAYIAVVAATGVVLQVVFNW